ncbi:SMI1/KNR4 family protein [Saccharothrix yanglingensis]|uniref:Knr4/Smi1-like domain-containing protein n=1 Tax=Saccharothrix yanglingensis TaxID=659496 RepID=A0ABU0X7G2_9PSEU|nr:SMI1/KNR4 family protein [Saccharothrix yanglingensis]MDQ2588075.1 hypothetical protein [Saccharothrix yanglingensis]
MDDVLVELSRALFGRAEGDWRQIVYRASFDEGGISSREEVEGDGKLGREPGGSGAGPDEALVGRFGAAVLELRVNPDRTYEALVVRDLSQHTAYLPPSYVRVLDPARRPPAALPASALPPVGDPARVPGLVAEYAALFESITGAAAPTEPPATEHALAEVEDRFDVVLPADLRALYLLGDGTARPPGPFGLPLLPLARIEDAREAMEWTDGFRTGHPDDWEEEVAYEGPADAVRIGWWHPGWVPVASNGHLLFLVVDLAPGPTGRPGQVLLADTQNGFLRYLAPSVTAWLEQVLDQIKAGEYRLLPGGDGFAPTWPHPPRTELSLSLEGTDLATALSSVEGLDEVRTVTLRHATGADLTPLAALLRLRHVSVTASEIDLAPLAGLPLRTARVEGGAVVEVPAWSGLVTLGLGGATPANLDSLPAAAYLVLHDDQWRLLPDPPEGLVAAKLTGQGSLARAVEWAAWLGAPVPAEVLRGTF